MSVRIERRARLPADVTGAVQRLVDDASETDGTAPLSEHVLLHLRYGGDVPTHSLLAWAPGDGIDGAGMRLVGYAHLDLTDTVAGPIAELVVAPDARGRGIGTALARAAMEQSPGGRLRLWAHGRHPAVERMARRLGFAPARVLWQMRRSLLAPLPVAPLPPELGVRTFVPGQDEEAWLALNERAFADHPEQGGWTRGELEARMREPWFDAAGFFLAERDGRLVGFHWTKVHGGRKDAADDGPHGHEPIGEVYVIGVDPAAAGYGLGTALTIIGLRHLRAAGLAQAMLYVDESNVAAMRMYERLGFTRWDSDVSYARG